MLSLVGKDLKQIKEKDVGTGGASQIQHLDVSYNQLNNGI
jgi:hypothetical protein